MILVALWRSVVGDSLALLCFLIHCVDVTCCADKLLVAQMLTRRVSAGSYMTTEPEVTTYPPWLLQQVACSEDSLGGTFILHTLGAVRETKNVMAA